MPRAKTRLPLREEFAPYIASLVRALRLNDWVVTLATEVPPDDPKALAAIEMTPGRRHARVFLSERFLMDSPEGQRHTIVHELVHMMFAASQEIASAELPDGAYRSWRLMHEYGVDAVADALAPSLPLPKIRL